MAFGDVVFMFSLLLIVTVLVLDLVGVLHRGTGFRVQVAGLLVMNAAQVVNLLAHLHYRGIFPVLFVGFAILVGGFVVSSRERRAAADPRRP